MNSGAYFRTLFAPTLLGLCVALTGCDDGDDGDDEGVSGGETTAADTTGTTTAEGGDTMTEVNVPINESFDGWDGGGDRFFMAKPDQQTDPSPYDDHNTLAVVDGQEAILIHHNAVDNDGNGFAIEFQLQLDQTTDLSSENYWISFDIYVPAATSMHEVSTQFAFYETANWTPIYSLWFTDLPADTWYNITSPISSQDGSIDFSNFANNPADWIVDVVRIQLIATGDTAAEGTELLFYVDNLIVSNGPMP